MFDARMGPDHNVTITDDVLRVIMRHVASELWHLPTFVAFLVRWRRVSRTARLHADELRSEYGRMMTEMLFHVRWRGGPASCFMPWCSNGIDGCIVDVPRYRLTYASPFCDGCLLKHARSVKKVDEAKYVMDGLEEAPVLEICENGDGLPASTIEMYCAAYEHWALVGKSMPRHALIRDGWSQIIRTIHNVAIDQFAMEPY
jgi:hypothetical protein